MKLKGISKPSNSSYKAIDRTINKAIKKATKKIQSDAVKAISRELKKAKTKRERYNLTIKRKQQKARDYIESLPGNFVVSDAVKNLAYRDFNIYNQRQFDAVKAEVDTVLNLSRMKRETGMVIGRWNKTVKYTDIDPEGNRITGDMPINGNGDSQWGKLDNPILTNISYDTWEEVTKNPNANSTKLAKALNQMMEYQREHFSKVEGPMKTKLWELAKDIFQREPGTFDIGADKKETAENKAYAYNNEYFKLVKFRKNGKMVEFKYDPNDPKKSAEDFWKAVRWKKLPGWVMKTNQFQYILHNPQTNYELYDAYLESASLRSIASNMKQMMRQIQQMTQLPVPAIRVLLNIMETSQSWNIALRGVDPSEGEADYSQQDNWKHIGMDLYLLERVPNTPENWAAIDKIISGIQNESRGFNVKTIMERTQEILAANEIKYTNTGRWHYDEDKDKYK